MKKEKQKPGRQKPLNQVRLGLSKKILVLMWKLAGRSRYQEGQTVLNFEDIHNALNPLGTQSERWTLYSLLSRHVKRKNVLKVVVQKDRKLRGRCGFILSQPRLDYMYRNKLV